jgi:hypothetical protein
MTYQEQLNNERILKEVEADFLRNPNDPSLRLLKSRLQSDPSQTKLGPGWFDDTHAKLLKGVHQGLLEPDILMQFHGNPVWVLQDLSKSVRDQLDLPSAEEAQGAIMKSFQAGHDGK